MLQVNVFISQGGSGQAPSPLVLPAVPGAAIPKHLQGAEWQHFATTLAGDKLLGASAAAIEDGITRNGYALVAPTG